MATERLILEVRTQGTRTVRRNIKGIAKEARAANKTLALLRSTLVVVAGARVIARFAKLADSLTNVQTRLKLVTNSTEELNTVQSRLFDIAQNTRSSFEETANLFNRLAASSKGLGKTYGELANVAKTVNQAVILSGVSAATAANGLQQFAQGLGQGTLRGDELRSVVENLPGLADIIAENFEVAGKKIGLSRGELIAFAKANEGILKTAGLIKALEDAADGTNETFKKVGFTVDQAFTRFNNRLVVFIGQLGQSVDIGNELDNVLQGIADNFGLILTVLLAFGGIAVFNLLTSQLVRFGKTGFGIISFLTEGFTNLFKVIAGGAVLVGKFFIAISAGATAAIARVFAFGIAVQTRMIALAAVVAARWTATSAVVVARFALMRASALAFGNILAAGLGFTALRNVAVAALAKISGAMVLLTVRVKALGVALTFLRGRWAVLGVAALAAGKKMFLALLNPIKVAKLLGRALLAVGVAGVKAFLGILTAALPFIAVAAAIAAAIAAIAFIVIKVTSVFVDWGAVVDKVAAGILTAIDVISKGFKLLGPAIQDSILSTFNAILRGITNILNAIISALNFFIRQANRVGADIGEITKLDAPQVKNSAAGAVDDLTGFIAERYAENLANDPTGKIKEGAQDLLDRGLGLFDQVQNLPAADAALLERIFGGPAVDKGDPKARKEARDDLLDLLAAVSPLVAATNELTDARETLDAAMKLGLITDQQATDVMKLLTREIIGVGNEEQELRERTALVNAALKNQVITANEAAVALGKLNLEATEAFDSALGGVFPLIAANRQLREVQQVVLEQQKGLKKAGIDAAEAQKRLLREAMGLPPTLEQTNEQMEALIKNQKALGLTSKELQSELRKVRLEFLEGQKGTAAGFERGAIKVLEEFTDTAKLAEEAVTNAFKNMEDVLVEFFKTGEFNFEKFIDGLTEDLTRLAVREAITGPLAELLFGGQGIGGLGGATGASGGAQQAAQAVEGAHVVGGGVAAAEIVQAHTIGAAEICRCIQTAGFDHAHDVGEALKVGSETFKITSQEAGIDYAHDVGEVLQVEGRGLGDLLTDVFNGAGDLFSSIFDGLFDFISGQGGGGLFSGGLLGGGGGGIFDFLGGLLPFAQGGSFEVNRQSALATLPGAGVDNRVIAFRANDDEQVTVSKRGESSQTINVNMGGLTINGAPDTPENRRAASRLGAKAAAEFSRQLERNT